MTSTDSTTSKLPPAFVAARALVGQLVALGLREVVLAPGSRSAPLAYAFAEAADAGSVRLHVRIDERSGAFLALGLARGQKVGATAPVAVVTTSGTAVANLHPAVLEAHHGQVPLLVLTADRPHELRGTGANQTTDQVEIFGSATRYAVDVPAPAGLAHEDRYLRAVAARAVSAAAGTRSGTPGPAHLNLSYRDPLAPPPGTPLAESAVSAVETGENSTETTHSAMGVASAPQGGEPAPAGVAQSGIVQGTTADQGTTTAQEADDPAFPAGRTIVVAGDGAGKMARQLAELRGWPLLAESVSGAAGGPNQVWAHAQVLAHAPIAQGVEHVVVLGRPTLSRPVQQLLARPGIEIIVVAPGATTWPDAANNASVVLPMIPASWLERQPGGQKSASSPGWLRTWRDTGQQAHATIVAALAHTPGPGLTGPGLVFKLWDFLDPADTLVVGSSNPVRDLDLAAAWTEPPRIVANRGLAGIDGMVSTAIGVALSKPPARGPIDDGVVRALMGDLTFLHDIGGLLRAPGEPEPDLQIIVANDQGGSIFAGLEHGALGAANPDAKRTFDRVFTTPHTADLAALCAGYGVAHTRVTEVVSLTRALAGPPSGISVLEVVLDGSDRRQAMLDLTAAIKDRLSNPS